MTGKVKVTTFLPIRVTVSMNFLFSQLLCSILALLWKSKTTSSWFVIHATARRLSSTLSPSNIGITRRWDSSRGRQTNSPRPGCRRMCQGLVLPRMRLDEQIWHEWCQQRMWHTMQISAAWRNDKPWHPRIAESLHGRDGPAKGGNGRGPG